MHSKLPARELEHMHLARKIRNEQLAREARACAWCHWSSSLVPVRVGHDGKGRADCGLAYAQWMICRECQDAGMSKRVPHWVSL